MQTDADTEAGRGEGLRIVFDRYNIVNEEMLRGAGQKLDAMQGGGV